MIWMTRSGEGVVKFELDRKAALIGHIRAASQNGKPGKPGVGAPAKAEEKG